MTTPLKLILPILVAILGTSCQSTRITRLAPFSSDECTCFPEGTYHEKTLWKQDCRIHDYAYWQGGTRKERRQADQELRYGIKKKGKPVIAGIAYTGVRIGGTPWLPTPWRWGYGWEEFPRGYQAHSEEEERLIKRVAASPDSLAMESSRSSVHVPDHEGH
ncbi:MAG: FAD-binding oxidoreductase [Verrucomicrobiota bacterium]